MGDVTGLSGRDAWRVFMIPLNLQQFGAELLVTVEFVESRQYETDARGNPVHLVAGLRSVADREKMCF